MSQQRRRWIGIAAAGAAGLAFALAPVVPALAADQVMPTVQQDADDPVIDAALDA
ncbi:MAG: hypothetical protein HOQ05_06900, partial [Corynebacteriales bacterium]|nr:hypothetical protein [Mycobacteriales bacterium]